MNKYILALAMVTLVGCSTTVPIAVKFPEVPAILLDPAPKLKSVDQGAANTAGAASEVKASELIGTVVENYGTYYQVVEQLRGWQDWYRTQKAIFEQVK